jgi:hypothetical protein
MDSPDDSGREVPERMGSNADAEDSAAHIAELVRRSTESRAAPGPSSVARPDPTLAQPTPVPAPSVAEPTQQQPQQQPRQQPRQPAATPTGSPYAQRARPTMSAPSRRTLVTAGAVLAVLIGGGVALSHALGPEVRRAPTATTQSSAPAGYAVKVTDVITDCASHARGRTKVSFEAHNCVKATRSIATGQISGRPALYVVSRIQMASAEAAAAVKEVLDGSGTGNLNDLLSEGKTFPGAPVKMPDSGYASVQTGAVLTVAEAGFVDGGPSSSTDLALRASAAQVAAMVSAQR